MFRLVAQPTGRTDLVGVGRVESEGLGRKLIIPTGIASKFSIGTLVTFLRPRGVSAGFLMAHTGKISLTVCIVRK
jgi:hypothetical protein